MPLTQLDDHAALVVIDLQKGIVGLPGLSKAEELIENAAQLVRSFRARKLPVVLVSVAGGAPGRTDAKRTLPPLPPDWSEIIPQLGHAPDDILVTKQRPGAFAGTALHEALQQKGVTQIFLAGVSTSFGVESTARSGYDLGYNVVFVTDAMADRDPATHEHCLAKIFPRLGESSTTEDVLRRLQGVGPESGANPENTSRE